MPIIKETALLHETKLGVWNIIEPKEFFLSKLILNETDKIALGKIKRQQKYLQWLASRYLIKIFINTVDDVQLFYDDQGKPFLNNYHLSISHSHDMVVVLMSKHASVGIDIEKIQHKIENIAQKFMHNDEISNLKKDFSKEHLYVYWSVKEAVYKLIGQKGLNFKEHIRIQPFDYKEKGRVDVSIVKNDFSQVLQVLYEKTHNYMLAYVVGLK